MPPPLVSTLEIKRRVSRGHSCELTSQAHKGLGGRGVRKGGKRVCVRPAAGHSGSEGAVIRELSEAFFLGNCSFVVFHEVFAFSDTSQLPGTE